MSCLVRNLQRKVVIDLPVLRRRTERLRDWIGVSHCDLAVTVVNETRMTELNGQFRRQHKPTDVLSVSPHAQLRPGEQIPSIAGIYDIGDVFLCATYIENYCKRHAVECFQSYLARLVCHGTLHLCGYTHDNDADFEEMQAKERELLARLTEEEKGQFRFDFDRVIDPQ